MVKIENKYKSSTLGIASNVILICTVIAVALYDYFNPSLPAGEESAAVVLKAFADFFHLLEIVCVGGFISVCLAIFSLIAKEKKIFPLITIVIIFLPLFIFAMLWIKNNS